ncbi:hypothetical protein LY08_01740 [Olleya aquimaris]|uniref:Uncharacterized protein n=1 Tax=Olleya aquimaris TaxID=639310 RepID=A0A327RF56_9FLAO|nr:hypothetical protein LY08_01740 [Olleya aquimaris]
MFNWFYFNIMYSGSPRGVLKNNRDLLKNPKRKKFVHIPGKFKPVKKEKFDHVVLNTEYQDNLRKRLNKENKLLFYKRLIVFIILFIGLLIWLNNILN